eukprot:s4020_g8.t1
MAHLPAEEAELSHVLLNALRSGRVDEDVQIFEEVRKVVEPFAVLRRTLQVWADELDERPTRAMAADVLLCFSVGLLCKEVHVTQTTECAGSVFNPDACRLVWHPRPAGLPGLIAGSSDSAAADFLYSLDLHPPPGLEWAAVLVLLPQSPVPCSNLCIAESSPLRSQRRHLKWLSCCLKWIEIALSAARVPARLPEPLFGLCSVGLGLLILSRVSSATERFSTARSLWADVVSAIRNLSRQAHLWAGRDEFIKFSRWLPALPAAMLCHLRRAEPELGAMLRASRGSRALQAADSSLSDREIQEVICRPEGMSSPRYVYLRIMALSTQLEVPELQKTALENELSRLGEALTACERSSEEVIQHYTRQTARLLFLWLALLPFALPSQLGVGAVLSHQLIAFGLLGIEDVGIQLEEPFKVLPLEGPCAKLAAECQALRVSWRRMQRGSEDKQALSFGDGKGDQSDQEVIRL